MTDPFAFSVHGPISSMSIAIDPPEFPGGAIVFWNDEDGAHSFAIGLPSRCAWCNAKFDEDGNDAVRAHIMSCERHPMARLRRIEAAARGFIGWVDSQPAFVSEREIGRRLGHLRAVLETTDD